MNSPHYAALPDHLREWLEQLPIHDRVVWLAAIFGGARPGDLPPLRWPAPDVSGRVTGGAR